MRTDLSAVVARQLPEFIREDYPAFVAFVEAYYAWLKTQQVDFVDARDLDKTLDQYIELFRKELAVHLPLMLEDERLVLPRIKELYRSKGSQASFKLLFRLLYGKNVEIDYPGQQMLKASDGTWNQEISVFAKVEYGDPDDVVGRLVDIVTAGRTIRVLVDRKEVLTGEVDRIVALGGDIYEFYLDKRFFGVINVGDKIKYRDTFQAEILPATQRPIVLQPGTKFRVGQVFQINSGGGTGALLKVTQVTPENGIKYCELIKFGIGYTSDFGVSILASNSINNYLADPPTSSSTVVGEDLTIRDRTLGFDEQGYVNYADWVDYQYIDATYAGTIAREFALNYRNAQTDSNEGAQLSIKLGALVKYPGYYTSNNGFLDDSIKLQDSFYYQKYSYVVKIDERLQNYKAAVKTLLHPTGMKLFGEFNITNKFDLSVALECIVKSLGIGLEDYIEDITDELSFVFSKALSTSQSVSESITKRDVSKALNAHYLFGGVTLDNNTVSPSDSMVRTTTKALNSHYLFGGVTLDNNSVSMTDANWVHSTTKALGSQFLFGGVTLESTSVTMTDDETFSFGKSLSDSQSLSDTNSLNIGKSLADTSVGTWTNTGKVWKNSYQAQDYYSEEYSVGLQTTFTN
jgi:hypothetical protein